jgi:hypothetical protein
MAGQRSKTAIRARLASVGIQPRGLSVEEAAAYAGLSAGSFLRAVESGTYPRPMTQPGERKVWDRIALDRAMDALSGLDATRRVVPHEATDDDIDGAIDRAYPKSAA